MKHAATAGLLALLAAGVVAPVVAQDDPARIEPAAPIAISLVTYGPGPLAWERFGHNGLWVRDPRNGIDRIYSYGYFDLGEQGFVLRFIRGRMLYSMESRDAGRELTSYIEANRTVWIQELELTPERSAALRDFLLRNDTAENRFYRYDYYRDNCSTRIRDAIDETIGGALRAATEGAPSGTSLRFHTRRLTHLDPLLYSGLLIGLGNPVDRDISDWEEMFLPIKVRDRVRELTTLNADGDQLPLVRSERTLHSGQGDARLGAPPRWLLAYLGIGAGLAVLILLSGLAAPSSRLARGLFAIFAGGWSLIAGLAGTGLAGLWALTDHATSYWNENLFFLTPLALPLAVLAFVAPGGRAPRANRLASKLAVAVALSSLLGLVLQLLPGFDQVNGEIIALALPPNLALAACLGRKTVTVPARDHPVAG